MKKRIRNKNISYWVALRLISNFVYKLDREELQSSSYLLRGWNKRWLKYNK